MAFGSLDQPPRPLRSLPGNVEVRLPAPFAGERSSKFVIHAASKRHGARGELLGRVFSLFRRQLTGVAAVDMYPTTTGGRRRVILMARTSPTQERARLSLRKTSFDQFVEETYGEWRWMRIEVDKTGDTSRPLTSNCRRWASFAALAKRRAVRAGP